MHTKSVSVTEAVRHFSEYVNRVAYRHETFLLSRGRKAMAELRPVPRGRRLGDLPRLLASLPRLSVREADTFAKDVTRARASVKREKVKDPWAS